METRPSATIVTPSGLSNMPLASYEVKISPDNVIYIDNTIEVEYLHVLASSLEQVGGFYLVDDVQENLVRELPDCTQLVWINEKLSVASLKALPSHINTVKLLGDVSEKLVMALPSQIYQVIIGHDVKEEAVRALPKHIRVICVDSETHANTIHNIPKHISSVIYDGKNPSANIMSLPAHIRSISLNGQILERALRYLSQLSTAAFDAGLDERIKNICLNETHISVDTLNFLDKRIRLDVLPSTPTELLLSLPLCHRVFILTLNDYEKILKVLLPYYVGQLLYTNKNGQFCSLFRKSIKEEWQKEADMKEIDLFISSQRIQTRNEANPLRAQVTAAIPAASALTKSQSGSRAKVIAKSKLKRFTRADAEYPVFEVLQNPILVKLEKWFECLSNEFREIRFSCKVDGDALKKIPAHIVRVSFTNKVSESGVNEMASSIRGNIELVRLSKGKYRQYRPASSSGEILPFNENWRERHRVNVLRFACAGSEKSIDVVSAQIGELQIDELKMTGQANTHVQTPSLTTKSRKGSRAKVIAKSKLKRFTRADAEYPVFEVLDNPILVKLEKWFECLSNEFREIRFSCKVDGDALKKIPAHIVRVSFTDKVSENDVNEMASSIHGNIELVRVSKGKYRQYRPASSSGEILPFNENWRERHCVNVLRFASTGSEKSIDVVSAQIGELQIDELKMTGQANTHVQTPSLTKKSRKGGRARVRAKSTLKRFTRANTNYPVLEVLDNPILVKLEEWLERHNEFREIRFSCKVDGDTLKTIPAHIVRVSFTDKVSESDVNEMASSIRGNIELVRLSNGKYRQYRPASSSGEILPFNEDWRERHFVEALHFATEQTEEIKGPQEMLVSEKNVPIAAVPASFFHRPSPLPLSPLPKDKDPDETDDEEIEETYDESPHKASIGFLLNNN